MKSGDEEDEGDDEEGVVNSNAGRWRKVLGWAEITPSGTKTGSPHLNK
jgi:hypothetical protein